MLGQKLKHRHVEVLGVHHLKKVFRTRDLHPINVG
jgi:hypothetical protein